VPAVSMANAGNAFNSQIIQGHSRNLKRSPQITGSSSNFVFNRAYKNKLDVVNCRSRKGHELYWWVFHKFVIRKYNTLLKVKRYIAKYKRENVIKHLFGLFFKG